MRKAITLAAIICISSSLYLSCGKDGGDDYQQPPPPPPPANPCAGVTVTVTGSVVHASTGQSNGSITATATGGSGFTYKLGSGVYQGTGTFTNLAAGTYTITARNSSGCEGSASFTVQTTNPCTGVNIVVNTTIEMATPCATPSTGKITVTATGSTGFTYSVATVNGGAFQASNVFSNLAAGNYTVTVKDANGCTASANAAVSNSNPGTLFSDVRTIIQANCAVSGCHTGSGAQNGIDFSNHCVIIEQRDRIKVRAVDQAGTPSQMPAPPNPPLSTGDRQKIVNWINAGGGFNH